MNVTELKNYLTEKNISVKDFAKITKVKEKKLTRVLDNQAFFTEAELDRVSAFLGVSKNELCCGVFERKGELPEVAEQNNLNHFRYYIKNRFKKLRYIGNILAFITGGLFAVLTLGYVGLMFYGITGLPTILRSLEVILCCLIIPVFGSVLFGDIAKEKLLEKDATAHCKINLESVGVSVMLLVYSICAFVNGFIPVVSLILILLGAVSLPAISVISPFKKAPFKNRGLQFFVYMIPTIVLIVAEVFIRNYVVVITPAESGVAGHALATASNFFSYVFALVISVVFSFCLLGFAKPFIKGVGKFFEPVKKTKTISKQKIIAKTILCILLCVASYLSITLLQGMYLKNMYTNMFEGQEETVNWTADFVTDFESQYKKGEYNVVKFEGLKMKIPKGYKFDKEGEYTTYYKSGEDRLLMLQKTFVSESLDFDLFDEDFGDGKLTEEQLEGIKEDFVKSFGFYPKNFYEWQKLNGMVTLDDIDIFNPRKTTLLSTVFIMKATAIIPDSEYYLYENRDLYATIIIHTIENEEKGDKEMVSVSFGSPNLEYSFTLARPDQDNDKTIEEVTKILNSVKVN